MEVKNEDIQMGSRTEDNVGGNFRTDIYAVCKLVNGPRSSLMSVKINSMRPELASLWHTMLNNRMPARNWLILK